MGGDEFAVLLRDVTSAKTAVEVGRKLLKLLGEAIPVQGHLLRVGASIGVALGPAHGDDLSTLLRNADTAMYAAKLGGRDRLSVYDEALARASNDRLQLLSELHDALANGELALYYQPLVDAESGIVPAFEALLRWRHPTRGLVPPNQFVPLAEESGLIVPIGAWALRQACADLASLRREGRPRLRMAVNISPVQFSTEGLETAVRDALDASGLDGSALELEITESTLMNSLERTQNSLAALRDMGVRLAIDDFGTGYSSLSYLANFPVQALKVDRSFVSKIETGKGSALLAGAIVAMAHSLGLDVVAEGVETPAQQRRLSELGCELLQGYLFSPAVPIEELRGVVERIEATPPLPFANSRRAVTTLLHSLD